jgi:hypothetical protein
MPSRSFMSHYTASTSISCTYPGKALRQCRYYCRTANLVRYLNSSTSSRA